MKTNAQHGRRAGRWAAGVLSVLVVAVGAPEPVRALPGTASRFVHYLSSVEAGGGKRMSVWDRVVYSLVLAGNKKERS